MTVERPIVTEPSWRVATIVHNADLKLQALDEGMNFDTPPPKIPEEYKARILSECGSIGVDEDKANRFLIAVEFSQWGLLGCLYDHHSPTLKPKEALTVLDRLSRALDDLESSGAIVALSKVSEYSIIYDPGEPTGFLPELRRNIEKAIQFIENTPLQKGAPKKNNRRQFVEAGMMLWESCTQQKATMSDDSGFSYIWKEVWNWIHENHNIQNEKDPSFRNDMRWIHGKGKKE